MRKLQAENVHEEDLPISLNHHVERNLFIIDILANFIQAIETAVEATGMKTKEETMLMMYPLKVQSRRL